jgi:hypothetical protein
VEATYIVFEVKPMMRKPCVLGVVIAACAALLLQLGSPPVCPADESKKGDETLVKVDPAATDVENIGMAYNLADYGRKHKAPEALVTAARILRRIRTTPLTDKPTIEVDKDAPKADKEKPPAEEPISMLAESDKLLTEAKKMAPDDKLIADLVERVSKEKTRGGIVVVGPRVGRGVVVVGRRHIWVPRVYRPRELLTAAVVGDGRTVLVGQVVNEAGVVVHETVGHSPSISYVPTIPGRYTVRVLTRVRGVHVPYTIYAR